MEIEQKIKETFVLGISRLYGQTIAPESIQLTKTRKDFEGDFSVNVFPYSRFTSGKVDEIATGLKDFLENEIPGVEAIQIVKGFLNIKLKESVWIEYLDNYKSVFLRRNGNVLPESVLIEFSSPNTNKPLHLGHVRNNLIGNSLTEILKANGSNVVKVNLVNDRGIHICKSMLAWMKWGNGETPASSGKKGDKLVGDYYVLFDKEYKKQVSGLMASGMTEEQASNNAELILEAREVLRKWESADPGIMELWNNMNGWVYEGFEKTYSEMGICFDKIYYESQTYRAGRDEVLKGLDSGVFIRKDDLSVWADLTEEGLDEKLLLRADGTSVYITQDIGTAIQRRKEFGNGRMIYVVGNEQDYHFQALKLLLKKLGYGWWNDIVHLSYGMVELPDGKMKSREGNVVDADDLIEEMYKKAVAVSAELGKLEGMGEDEKTSLIKKIGLGALKYFILKVDPRKKMLFIPEESVDFNGNTGPFIQYTYARIKSVLRKTAGQDFSNEYRASALNETERNLTKTIYEYNNIIRQAGEELKPSLVANYVYSLAKDYNQFYQNYTILKDENKSIVAFRLKLSEAVADRIKECMRLLGIEVPEKM